MLGGLDALALGALVFVTATLLVINVWSVVDTRMALTAAAREAVRDLVDVADADIAVAQDRAAARALETLAQHGRPTAVLDQVSVAITAPSLTLRCSPITVAVTAPARMIGLPFVGGFTDGHLDVTVAHTEILDSLRSGLEGLACG